MDTKRPPALTSPWKIGFLVSLLLIFLSVGVNYMIFRTFNLTWTCIGIDQGRLFFHRDQFLSQLFPLIALVALASLIAYFSITAAVRRYRIYLDSGQDYRNLIRLIREASDLENEKIVAGLKKYPELREMLNGFRDRISEKEKLLDERENQQLVKEKNTIPLDVLSRECAALTQAIRELPPGKQLGDQGLTIPDLDLVEKAVGSMTAPAAGGSRWGDENNEKFENLSRDIRDANDYLKNRLEESTIELQSSCSGAQDIEKQLSELCGGSDDGSGGAAGGLNEGDLKVIHQMLGNIEKRSETLNDLGEEAKGVAINTALQAGSGEGAQADLIQLAEDVRRVAVKFIDVSMSYQDTIEHMRKSVTEVGTRLSSRTGEGTGGMNLGVALNAVKSKVSLWVERMIILSDQFKNIDETVGLSMSTIEKKLSAGRAEAPASGMDTAGADTSQGIDTKTGAEDVPMDDFEVVAGGGEMFVGDKDSDQVPPDGNTSDNDIPGLKNDTGQIFSKPDEESKMFNELSKAGESEVEPPAAGPGIEKPEAAFEELPPIEPGKQSKVVDLPTQKHKGLASDFAEETIVPEFNSSEKQDDAPSPVDEVLPENQAEPERVYDLDDPGSRPAGVEAGGDEDEEEAIDLYALGAVDYAQ